MNDQFYLEKIGINEEGEPLSAPTAESAPAASSSSPQTPFEIYEVGEYKLPSTSEFKLTHDGKIMKVPLRIS